MKLAAYEDDGKVFVGRVDDVDQFVVPLALSASEASRGVQAIVELLASGADLPPDGGDRKALAEVKLIAPIPRPRRNIICVGRNYRDHAKELAGSVFKSDGTSAEAWPIIFSKMPETVVGPYSPVRLHAGVSERIDYEAELAVIIGKGGVGIAAADALDHVFGYTIINDVTARDVQMQHQQWLLGKSFDTFCPMGPWIVTRDECDGTDTRVRCWVNGQLRQDGVTPDLIFNIPTLIETCSRAMALLPGDIIATGTPAGVGMGMDPPRYLRAGDVVRIEIDGIGAIENRFVD